MIKCMLCINFKLLLLFNLILSLIFFMSGDTMGAVALPDGFTHELVASGMTKPVGLTFLPDGRLLVIEQRGAIRLVVNGIVQPGTILDIQDQVRNGGEQGLLGIAVDPEYPTRPFIYLYYTHETEKYHYITRFTMTGTLTDPLGTDLLVDPDSYFYLLTDIPRNASNHNGGTLRFGTDGMLYAGLGDDAGYCVAQLRDDLRGVILRMDVSGLPLDSSVRDIATKSEMVPLDNPFASALNDNEKLVWAYGLRNPFRFSIDSVTGNLFIGDVGLGTYEEISMSVAPGGENFGWPYREGYDSNSSYAECYGDPEPVAETVEPIGGYYQVSGSYSIIGGGVYHPVNYPYDLSWPLEFDGDYFFADYYQGFLIRLKDQGDGTWAVPPPVSMQPSPEYLITGLTSPSDFTIGPDGAVYYISQWDGSIFKIGYIASGLIPDIKGNYSDGPVTPTDNLSVTVALDPGSRSGENADWWVAANVSGTSTIDGWYYFDLSAFGFVPVGNSPFNLVVTHQGPLFNLSTSGILNIPVSVLPSGTYTFYLAVDMNMNGSLDIGQLFSDGVVVNIAP